jgi:hypothetical protein
MMLGEDFDALSVDGVKSFIFAMNVSCGSLGVLNGGGWGYIYSHQTLPSRCYLLPRAAGSHSWSRRSTHCKINAGSQRSFTTTISMTIIALNVSSAVK